MLRALPTLPMLPMLPTPVTLFLLHCPTPAFMWEDSVLRCGGLQEGQVRWHTLVQCASEAAVRKRWNGMKQCIQGWRDMELNQIVRSSVRAMVPPLV